MNAAREEMLRRVGAALAATPRRPPAAPGPPAYRRSDERAGDDLLDLLADRLEDYGARVQRVRADTKEIAAAIGDACRLRGTRRVVIPADLPPAVLPEDVEAVVDAQLSARDLDAVDGVVTGCALAIAETGTIALDGGFAQGRRALTLLPDHHVCVVHADQVVGLVPEAIEALRRGVVEDRRPITLISGPSATSDIELRRVEGVHGPRKLDVILVSN